ncbi:MAG TPA: copper chaperone PCu(A)C [Anaerolineae bacterium]|nr:copper chaperone PCu(A)C [Anaerolineae bacterium]
MKFGIMSLTLLVAAMLLATGCGMGSNGAPKITVSDPYVPVAPGANGAAYLKLVNEGSSPDVLLGVESQVAEAVEMHETKLDENDVMSMSPLSKIEVPAGGSVSLEPGGKHIMLINLQQALKPGEKISLTLNFEKSGPLAVEAEIRQIGAAMEHNTEHADDHGDHDH